MNFKVSGTCNTESSTSIREGIEVHISVGVSEGIRLYQFLGSWQLI